MVMPVAPSTVWSSSSKPSWRQITAAATVASLVTVMLEVDLSGLTLSTIELVHVLILYNEYFMPRVCSRVVRIDLLCFLAGCRTRRLNQAQSVYYILACYIIILWFIRAPFYVLLVFVAMCSVFWLFWLSCHYLPSDWLERLL